MKRTNLVLLIAILGLFFASCATSKQARQYTSSVNGNWQLQTVTTEGISGKVKIELFNEADFNCFVGSSWVFHSRNNLGSYTIQKNAGECAAITREFRWSIFETPGEPKMLQFKRLDSKLREIDENGGGFRFSIEQLDGQIMRLKSKINFEGKASAIVYNFVKN
jgi:hypothetical protein